MPVIKLYQHGLTGGVAPMKNSHQRAKRGDVQGWSTGDTRRNMAFLMSIDTEKLTGAGVTFTLTLRDCPETADAWHKLRRAFEMRMVRAGILRMHWVTEWQRRGVPHLHGVLWWPDIYDMVTIVRSWVEVAERYGAGVRGQHAAPINNAVGWFQYLSKHAARGVLHYQRSAENIPTGWRERTGRVWGKVGDWPVRPVVRVNLQDQNGDGGWFAFRRLCRSWRIADAKKSGDRFRIRSARSMLKCPCDPNTIGLSRVRGVSEWIPSDVQQAFLFNLGTRGFFLFDDQTGEILGSSRA